MGEYLQLVESILQEAKKKLQPPKEKPPEEKPTVISHYQNIVKTSKQGYTVYTGKHKDGDEMTTTYVPHKGKIIVKRKGEETHHDAYTDENGKQPWSKDARGAHHKMLELFGIKG